jgi:hypothetical protein
MRWFVFVNFFALLCLAVSVVGLFIVVRDRVDGGACPSYTRWLYGSSVTSTIVIIPMIIGYDVVWWYLRDGGARDGKDGPIKWTLHLPFFLILIIYLCVSIATVYHGIHIIAECDSKETVVGMLQCALYLSVFVVTIVRSTYLLLMRGEVE